MKIARVELLSAGAGWRIHDFIKLELSDGTAGWSEFSRASGAPGVAQVVPEISAQLIGRDPRSAEVSAILEGAGCRSRVAHQACGALQNALLDVRARALGVPVYDLLGTRVRDRMRVYWSHCGTYRVGHALLMRKPAVTQLADLVCLGREVVERGYTAVKTNLLVFDEGRARRYVATKSSSVPQLARALGEQVAAFREGTGPGVDIMVDLGSNFGPDAAVEMARAVEPYNCSWIELDLDESDCLRLVRERCGVAVASGERLQCSEYDGLLRAAAVSVAIVDVLCNGLKESLKVASACAAYDMPLAIHNCYSPLATMMAAAFCAVVPNVYLLEHDVDAVPWDNDFVTQPPRVRDGYLSVPSGAGWGIEVDEAAVRAHPLVSGE